MPLLRNNTITNDPWRTLKDDAPLPPSGRVIVSLDRWQAERATLTEFAGRIGIRLRADQSPVHIADDLERFDLVALEFPAFKDGRAYSYARLLRERFGYKGEVRAVGEVLRDQLLFMARCGFDAFEVTDALNTEDWRSAMTEFSVFYQPAADGRPTAAALRANVRSRNAAAA